MKRYAFILGILPVLIITGLVVASKFSLFESGGLLGMGNDACAGLPSCSETAGSYQECGRTGACCLNGQPTPLYSKRCESRNECHIEEFSATDPRGFVDSGEPCPSFSGGADCRCFPCESWEEWRQQMIVDLDNDGTMEAYPAACVAFCGDGISQSEIGEECDPGSVCSGPLGDDEEACPVSNLRGAPCVNSAGQKSRCVTKNLDDNNCGYLCKFTVPCGEATAPTCGGRCDVGQFCANNNGTCACRTGTSGQSGGAGGSMPGQQGGSGGGQQGGQPGGTSGGSGSGGEGGDDGVVIGGSSSIAIPSSGNSSISVPNSSSTNSSSSNTNSSSSRSSSRSSTISSGGSSSISFSQPGNSSVSFNPSSSRSSSISFNPSSSRQSSISFSNSFGSFNSLSSLPGGPMCGNGVIESPEQCDNGSACTQNRSITCDANADCRLCMIILGTARCGGSPTGKFCTRHSDCVNENYFCAYDTAKDFTCTNGCQRTGGSFSSISFGSSSRSSSIGLPSSSSRSSSFGVPSSSSRSSSISFNPSSSRSSSIGLPSSSSRSSSISFGPSSSRSSTISFGVSSSSSRSLIVDSCPPFCPPSSSSFGFSFGSSFSSCTNNNQCPSGVCLGNVCIPICGDGIRENPEQCDDGNNSNFDGCNYGCVIECTNNNECPSGICQNGICTPGGSSSRSSSSFAFSASGNNSTGFSFPTNTSSRSSARSSSSFSFYFSNPPTPCIIGNQCPSGQCQNGVCTPNNPCSNNSQCPSGQCVNGSCVPNAPPQCSNNAQCPNGQICLNGNCLPVAPCNSNNECPSGQCTNGFCLPTANPECSSTADCPTGVCVNNFCVPGCFENTDCALGTCVNNSCLPCASNDECANGICVNGVCSNPTLVASATVCGNGVLELNEECDDNNQRDADGCSATCFLEIGICGDGIVQKLMGEQCEASTHNPSLPYACQNCRYVSALCGDGKVDAGEECDLGQQNSNSPNATCRPSCSRPRCGDNIVDTGEQCDDGNRIDNDGCNRLCTGSSQTTQVAANGVFGNQNINWPNRPTVQGVPFQLPLAQLQPLIQGQGPVGDTGPAAVAVIAAGAASGLAWVRRKRK